MEGEALFERVFGGLRGWEPGKPEKRRYSYWEGKNMIPAI